MTSIVAQACSVPLNKLQSLADELRLLKSTVDSISGRLESVLTEIAHLHRDVTSNEELSVGATEQAEARRIDYVETVAVEASIEAASASDPPLMVVQEVAVAEPAAIETAHVVATPLRPCGVPSTAIVLYLPRAATERRHPAALRAVGGWAAVAALIALVIVVAAAGTGFAGFGEITISKAACRVSVSPRLRLISLDACWLRRRRFASPVATSTRAAARRAG